MKTQTETTKPFKKLDYLFVTRPVPGTHLTIGARVTIASATNTATKRAPNWRYYVAGAWLDHDALSTVDPLAGQR